MSSEMVAFIECWEFYAEMLKLELDWNFCEYIPTLQMKFSSNGIYYVQYIHEEEVHPNNVEETINKICANIVELVSLSEGGKLTDGKQTGENKENKGE